MIRILLTIAVIFTTGSLFSQDKPVPEYLTKQDFPDSIKTLRVITFSGDSITFSGMLDSCAGKKVVLDIWASWCRDCFVGLPKLEALRAQTGEEKVVYLFLSVDTDAHKWRNAIAKFDIQGQHYMLLGGWKTPLSKYINLDWVPRYMVLNEKGRVTMPKAIEADQISVDEIMTK